MGGFGPACTVLLTVFMAGRLLSSFLPCEYAGPSGYLCGSVYLGMPAGESHTLVAKAAIPEGVRLSNRGDFLTFREERFTVDARGNRNGPAPFTGTPRAVLFGSSFSLGMALSDEQTFSAQLNHELGPVVYSAATTFDTALDPAKTLAAARAAGMRTGWILLEVLNRAAYSYVGSAGSPSAGAKGGVKGRLLRLQESVESSAASARVAQRFVKISNPVLRVSTLLNLRLHNDQLLPNPYRDRYAEEELVDGRHVLRYAGDKAFALHPAAPEPTAVALARFHDDLAREGYHLAVVLLPNAYSVYSPLLRLETAPDQSNTYMAELYARLTTENVPAFNLLPPLREAARTALGQERVIYYSDDAHWNPEGVATAASVVAPWLQNLMDKAN